MNTLRNPLPDIVLRLLAWSVVIPVAVFAFAPDSLALQDGQFEPFIATFIYLPLGVGAVLWAAASLRPGLGVVVEDAFGRRSDLANAASGCTTTTFAVFGLAFAVLGVPGGFSRGEAFWPLVTSRLGWLFVFLGIAALAITIRSVKRRNARELYRRVIARTREEVEKDLNETLAKRPPRAPPAPATW